ncbi:uncharacterized protein, partial [Tiliqua scincoides]|uniref:uncharacterized protein n=1 Tax=Tiliqua scincoides TaxID=71010 RepID=UPI003461F1E0
LKNLPHFKVSASGKSESISSLFQFSSQLTSQLQVKDNCDGSKALTVDELYSSLEQRPTEMLESTLCSKASKELTVGCPVSAMQTKQRVSRRRQTRRQMNRPEAPFRARRPVLPVRTLSLDFQKGLPLSVLGRSGSSYTLQEAMSKDEGDHSEMRLLDLRTDLSDAGKDQRYFPESWAVEHMEGGLCCQPVNTSQVDEAECLIRQQRRELLFHKSEVRHFHHTCF